MINKHINKIWNFFIMDRFKKTSIYYKQHIHHQHKKKKKPQSSSRLQVVDRNFEVFNSMFQVKFHQLLEI